MKNPLALFTGAALATLAALAGLNMTNWPGPTTNVEKTPKIAAETQQPVAGETAKVPEKPAAEEAGKTPEKPAETAVVQVPEPKAEAEIKPELDTVRVESDGQTIVAGRGKPGAEVSLKLGDKVLGKGIANADGSWVVVPDDPLPKGAHELTVEQKAADSAPVLSDQAIAVAVPENAGQQAMVALTKPGAATKVLQSGENQQQAEASSATAEPAAPEQPAAEKPAETGQQTPEAQPPADTAQKPPETAEPAGQTEQPATTMAEAKPAEATQSAETAQPAKTAESVPLRLDAVDYNDKGDIIFSGRAPAGSAIRLYVDNGRVGDAIVDQRGNWSFSGSDIIKPGTHTLRADQIDKGGKVMARIELPFQREDADAVAALNTPTAPEPAETQPSQTTEVQPSPQTTEVAKTEPQTTEVQPSPQTTEVAKTEPQTTEVQPPQTEVAKTEPEASGPAPDQPVAEDKKEEVTTAAAAAAEQAAKTNEPDQPRTGKVVIQPGNNLWKLSRIIYGRGKNYTVIYQANKEQIRSPHRIYPGQIFAIPNANPPELIDPKRKDPLTSAEGGAAQ